jgi:hypothetical protein
MGAGIGEEAECLLLRGGVLAHKAETLGPHYPMAADASGQKTGLTAHLTAIKAYNA